jgi:RNA polymerase sigma-70 factor (ECF subfamily)
MIGDNNIQKQFGHLYNQYRQRFVLIAKRYVRDRMVAEDIVADSFVAFWNSRSKLTSETNLPAYILTIVKNNCLNWLRAQQIHFRIQDDIASVQSRLVDASIRSLTAMDPSNLFASDVQNIISEATSRMLELTREIFMLSRNAGMTYAEIAAELGISQRRVTSEMQAALSILRKALKDYIPAWLLTLHLFCA